MNLGAAVLKVRSQGGFDVSADEARAEINERYTIFCARTKWRKGQITSIGPTVAETAEYALSDDVFEVEGLMVDDVPYTRVGQRTLWDLKAGTRRIRGSGGVFAPDFAATGTEQIELYPAPTESGLVIAALAVLKPDELTADAHVPVIPVDFHEACMVDGPIASFLARVDERVDQAPFWEQRFEIAVEQCRRRQNARLSSGPSQIQVAGKHF